MIEKIAKKVYHQIIEAQRIAITTHIRPDGDAIGSLLGLGLALQKMGKTVQMALSEGRPHNFRYLYGIEQIQNKFEEPIDLLITLDCSDLLRVGGILNGRPQPDINIDHHVTNEKFARLNLVDPEATATAAVLTEILLFWQFQLDSTIASALLTGIISDTLGFRTNNMNPKTLRLAATLMEAGADLPELYQYALVRRSFESVQYWAHGLSRVEKRGRVVWTALSLEDRKASNYPGNDDADLVNILSGIEDYDIALIFVEQKGGKVKVSWRSQPGIDVSGIAESFGGWGHLAAAGADIIGKMEEVQQQVLEKTFTLLEQVG